MEITFKNENVIQIIAEAISTIFNERGNREYIAYILSNAEYNLIRNVTMAEVYSDEIRDNILTEIIENILENKKADAEYVINILNEAYRITKKRRFQNCIVIIIMNTFHKSVDEFSKLYRHLFIFINNFKEIDNSLAFGLLWYLDNYIYIDENEEE